MSSRALARPLRTSPATSARLCRRASASIARLRPGTSFSGRAPGAPRPPLSKGRELVLPNRLVPNGRGSEARSSTSAVHPLREHDPSNRENPAPQTTSRFFAYVAGRTGHGAPWSVGLQPSVRGPPPLSRRRLNRRLRGAFALARRQFFRYPVTTTASTSRRSIRAVEFGDILRTASAVSGGGDWTRTHSPSATWRRPIARPPRSALLCEPAVLSAFVPSAKQDSRTIAPHDPRRTCGRGDPRCFRSERPLAGRSLSTGCPQTVDEWRARLSL